LAGSTDVDEDLAARPPDRTHIWRDPAAEADAAAAGA
jgi:hypothetical protein